MKLNKKFLTVLLSSIMVCSVSLPYLSEATQIETIRGKDRYDTAFKISEKVGSYNTVILVNSTISLADGLSASGLSGAKNAPIIPVRKDDIPEQSLKAISSASNVYIIGGDAAISKKVEASLIASGKVVNRIEGSNRIETSQKVADLIGNYDKAFVVNGFKGEADAMSISSVAAREGAPIILTDGNNPSIEKKNGVEYYVIGGSTVASNKLQAAYSAKRLAGNDRYKTNRAILNKFYPNSKKLYCANGTALIDALTVSLLAKDNGIAFVGNNSDNSILKGKDIVNVGKVETETNKPNKPVTVEYFKPLILDQSTKNKMKGLSMPDNATGIKYDDLRRVNVKYWGFDNKAHTDGVLIVNKSVANDICSIFNDLYKAKYPIEKIRMIDEYKADDESSMKDNNTSSFCYRLIAGTKVLSKHGKGVAIDINPLYNPQVKNGKVYPSISKPYADRSKNVKGMIKKGDACYKAFTSRGWKWGGNWKNSKDYQHFEKIQ